MNESPALSQDQARLLHDFVKEKFKDAPDPIPVGVTYTENGYGLRFFCRSGQEETQQAMVDFLQKTSAKHFEKPVPDFALLIEAVGTERFVTAAKPESLAKHAEAAPKRAPARNPLRLLKSAPSQIPNQKYNGPGR